MPIIPPSLPWKPLRAAVDVLTAAASRALNPVLEFAAAYPPPRPPPPVLGYCGIVTRDGIIEQILGPDTLASLQQARTKTMEGSNGEGNVTIVTAAVGRCLKPGMSSGAILDVAESQLARGYEILLAEHHRFRF